MEPQAYAVYRSQLEAGHVAYTHFLNTEEVRLETKVLLDSLSAVIPETVIGLLMAQEGGLVDDDAPPPSPEEQARLATRVFGEYSKLRAALDERAGDTYQEIVQLDAGAESGGIEWWAVALSAAGALRGLGAMVWVGVTPAAIVAKIAATLLLWTSVYFGLTAVTPEGKTIIEHIAHGAVETGGSLKSILLWALGGLAVVGVIGAGVYVYNLTQDRRAERRGQRELAAAES
jgi:hypothetical protein